MAKPNTRFLQDCSACEEFTSFADAMSLRRFRTMAQFAEQEIILPPSSPHGANLPYRINRQPFSRLWFEEIDSHRWREHFAAAPSQSGKTLQCWVIPIMYHLFEIQENVIAGVPDMNMAIDKWNDDLYPVIMASRYANLMPTDGAGSKGGRRIITITFRNGTSLRFMSAQGGDKSKAGKTARIIAITELGGFGDVSASSDESNAYQQLLARTEAHDDRKVIYAECTVTTTNNIVWSKYLSGSASRLYVQCRHCLEWVSPERDHLIGFQDAENVIDAGARAVFACPKCGGFWTSEDRWAANSNCRIVHRGQTINQDGAVTGDMPKTRRLGFRWNAFNNMFKKVSSLAEKEWESLTSEKEEEEVALRQFTWAVPTEPTEFETIPLDRNAVQSKVLDRLPRGISPSTTHFLTAGVDCGDHLLHWTVAATLKLGDGEWATHIVNYGLIEVPSKELGLNKGYEVAFNDLYDLMSHGFTVEGVAENWLPWQVFIDANWRPEMAHRAVAKFGNRYRATQGRGKGQRVSEDYHTPDKTTQHILELGNRWHVKFLPDRGCELLPFDANHFKTAVHDGLRIPSGKPGSLSIFYATWQEHLKFSKHLVAEKQIQEYDPRRGLIRVWVQDGQKANHWLDSTALSLVAQSFCLQQLQKQQTAQPQPKATTRSILSRPENSSLGIGMRRL